MPSARPCLPKDEEVARLLAQLLNRHVTGEVQPRNARMSSPLYQGNYIDPEGRRWFSCMCDLPLAAYAGAALLSVPVSRAKENIAAGKLEELLEENIREILNIFSQCLNAPARLHMRLESVELAQQPLPSPVQRQLKIAITGYGEGRMLMMPLQESGGEESRGPR